MGDIAYTVKPTGSLYKHSRDYINDALDSGGSLLYKVFINILENIAIIAHIVKSTRLNRNDGLDGVGSGLYKVFINISDNIAIIAHPTSAKLKPNDGLDGGGRGLDRVFDQYLGKYRDYRTYPKSAKLKPQ